MTSRDAVPPVPVASRLTTGAPGSLLTILMVAASGMPGVVGTNWMVKLMSSPPATTSGVPGLASTWKPVEPISRWTLLMTRSPEPTLKICTVR